jgi:hypothetical protein
VLENPPMQILFRDGPFSVQMPAPERNCLPIL